MTQVTAVDPYWLAELGSEEVDPFPPGLSVIRQGENVLYTGYFGKNRSGYVASNPETAASGSTVLVASTSGDRAAGNDSRLAELARIIRQFGLQVHEPPPSYYAEPE